jgi:hypothetical protein
MQWLLGCADRCQPCARSWRPPVELVARDGHERCSARRPSAASHRALGHACAQAIACAVAACICSLHRPPQQLGRLAQDWASSGHLVRLAASSLQREAARLRRCGFRATGCGSGWPGGPGASGCRAGFPVRRRHPRAVRDWFPPPRRRSSASWRRECRPEMPAASSSSARREPAAFAWISSPIWPWRDHGGRAGAGRLHRRTEAARRGRGRRGR